MLIEFLNDYYAADFKKIHDIAGNQHLVGHSVRFDKDLFVKIFTESEMFYAEQNVYQVYCPEIYLDSVIFGDKYIVVLIDRELHDTDAEPVDEQRAAQYGEMLARFHQKVTDKVLVADYTKTKLSDRILNAVDGLKNTKYEEDVKKAMEILRPDFDQADEEYKQLPHVVLHGDFSLRNIKRYKDSEVLIDFEWASVGVAYEDFIKIFYNEVKNPKLRSSFIEGYKKICDFEVPGYGLQRCLLFLCALNICRFHVTHEREKFGDMPDRMLKTIENGNAIVELD